MRQKGMNDQTDARRNAETHIVRDPPVGRGVHGGDPRHAPLAVFARQHPVPDRDDRADLEGGSVTLQPHAFSCVLRLLRDVVGSFRLGSSRHDVRLRVRGADSRGCGQGSPPALLLCHRDDLAGRRRRLGQDGRPPARRGSGRLGQSRAQILPRRGRRRGGGGRGPPQSHDAVEQVRGRREELDDVTQSQPSLLSGLEVAAREGVGHAARPVSIPAGVVVLHAVHRAGEHADHLVLFLGRGRRRK